MPAYCGLNVELVHGMHEDELDLGAIVPGGHGVQEPAEDADEYPEGQTMHDVAGDDANDPGASIKNWGLVIAIWRCKKIRGIGTNQCMLTCMASNARGSIVI